MERLDFNRWQMEREPPLLLRCSDTAALIAWSCLGGTKSSWAMTWGEQAPGFVVRKIVYLTSTTSIIPLLYLASPCQDPSLSVGEARARQRGWAATEQAWATENKKGMVLVGCDHRTVLQWELMSHPT